jgi:hypothetical protein
MIVERASSTPLDLKTRLCQVVVENKISSIEKLSELTGFEEEDTRQALQDLVSEGSLAGSFTEDGSRFFLSDVKVSDAPILAPADVGPEIQVIDTKVPKTVVITGIILLVAGFVIRGLTVLGEIAENGGAAVIMVGMAVLIVGWMMFSRLNPPSDKRP